MNPWIVWAGVAALAIICLTIVFLAAIKTMPKDKPDEAPTRPVGRTMSTEEAHSLFSKPQYGQKDQENNNNG